jgi:hypothetical protein
VIGELELRRYRAGELDESRRVAIDRELAANPVLRAKLEALDDEQRAFEREVPFERFAAGIARARRKRGGRRPWMIGAGGALAVAAAILLFVRPAPSNRLKGGDDLVVARVGGAEGQRDAVPGAVTALAPGERVRVGYRVEGPRHLVVLALDDAGAVTPLYPAAGAAMAVAPVTEPVYLPDSVEFTGSGRERLSVLVGERSFTVDDAIAAARLAFERARGDVAAAVVAGPVWAETAFVFTKP